MELGDTLPAARRLRAVVGRSLGRSVRLVLLWPVSLWPLGLRGSLSFCRAHRPSPGRRPPSVLSVNASRDLTLWAL